MESSWVRHAIWWHAFPLRFGDGLKHLEAWLDHILSLGASGLVLGPIFASETHGYDTTDHYRIDPRLGADEDFDSLVAAASERGIRILLDGVFNHVGRSHAAMQREGWVRRRGDDYEVFEGHDRLVTLNHDNPEVVDFVSDVMIHWIGRGVSGFRLDAAYAVPTAFWAQVSERVRAAHPDAYLFGEVIHGDYPRFVAESGLDSVTQYELWKAIWSSLNDGNFFELAHALGRHSGFLADFVPYTFLGNHDVTRIASQLTDPGLLTHALAVLTTVGGTPSVYAGDEHAFRGVKYEREGGDDEIRPPFPPTPADLSRLGLPAFRLHQELLGLRRRLPWLHDARTTVLHTTNTSLSYESTDGTERIVVALSTDLDPVTVPTPGARALLAGHADLKNDESRLNPAGWAVLSC